MTDPRITLTATDKTAAAFRSVIDRVDRVGKGLDGMRVAAVAAVGSLAAIGAAGTAAFAFTVRQADAIAKFQELSDKVGDSAVEIASLKTASDVSGVGLDTIAAASIRLTAALSKTDDESKGVGAALRALGVDLETFKGQRPVEQIDTLAQAFARFEDGAEKTAVAVALFGKAGAEVLPFMKDLAEQGGRQARLTEAQIEAADKFTKQLALLRSELDQAAQVTAGPMVEAMNRLIERFRLGRKEGLGFFATALRIYNENVDEFYGVDRAKQLEDQVANLDRFLARQGIQEDRRNAALETRRSLLIEIARLRANEMAGDQANQSEAETRRLGRRNVLSTSGLNTDKDKTPKTPKEDPVERYLENLQRQLQLTQDLTVEEKLLADIQAGRLGKVTELQQQELRGLAAKIDAAKARDKQVKENRQAFLDDYDNNLKPLLDDEEKRRERINALIADTPTSKLEEQRAVMKLLADELQRADQNGENLFGKFGSEEAAARFSETANSFLGNLEKTEKQLDDFTKRAAENIQDYLGQGLYDLMSGNFDNIGSAFTQMLNRMVAEAGAAQLSKYLLGDLVKGGEGSGLLGSAVKAVGSWIGSIVPKFDVGTDFVPRDMLAVVHKGEAIIPAAENARGGRGGPRINQTVNFSIQGPVDRRSEATLAKAATRALQRAQRWM